MRSIATSVFAPSKEKWEGILQGYLGAQYTMISAHSLGGTHLAVFAHINLVPIISNIKSDCLATGIQNLVGNKGAVGISFNLGQTSLLCISCHLASGQNGVDRRNQDFTKIFKRFVLNEQEEPERSSCLGGRSNKTIPTGTTPTWKRNMILAEESL